MRTLTFPVILLLSLGLLGLPARADEALDGGEIAIGQVQELNLEGGLAIGYTVAVDAAGMLTVVTRGKGGDLVLEVTDADNQPLRGGQADIDLNDNMCNEQLVLAIPYPDSWTIKVTNASDETTNATLVAGFVAYEAVAREPDPDGRPSLAATIEIGQSREDSLDSSDYDLVDWLRVVPPEDGRLAVFTKGDPGLDIGVRVITGDRFDQVVGEGDSDLAEQTANEGLVVPVRGGVAYYIQVLALVDSAGDYKIGTQFLRF